MSEYTHGDTSWWQEARFGMFIHWGLYSMPARHEWVRHYEKTSIADYEKYFELFNPDMFNPTEWAKAAKNAGMKYIVFTTKHHEGFCMWDTQYTDYKITNTPYGKDILRELADAFRAEGIKIGLYYSLLDWHHPDFTVDCVHPHRDDQEEIAKNNRRDMRRYAEYMRNQVTELLTGYGDIDIIWFDFSYPKDWASQKGRDEWESDKMIRMIRKIKPDILINNRLDIPEAGDFITPEQYVPTQGIREDGKITLWEGCQTFSGSWGYHRDETTWKSHRMLIEILIRHVSRGGNLLMNVGPTARGFLDERAMNALNAYGQWMKYHARSIYGCTLAPPEYPEPEYCRYTYNPDTKRLYLHLLVWPFKFIHLPNLAGKVKYAQLLNDGSEITFRDASTKVAMNENAPQDALSLNLPPVKPNTEIPVIEIFMK